MSADPPKLSAKPPAPPAATLPEDQAREAPPKVLTPEEKRKLGAEASRTEDA